MTVVLKFNTFQSINSIFTLFVTECLFLALVDLALDDLALADLALVDLALFDLLPLLRGLEIMR